MFSQLRPTVAKRGLCNKDLEAPETVKICRELNPNEPPNVRDIRVAMKISNVAPLPIDGRRLGFMLIRRIVAARRGESRLVV